jgi:hypothetical protein
MNLQEIPPTVWIGSAAAVTTLGAGVAGAWWYRGYRARRELAERVGAVGVEHLQDVILPDGNGGWFHVDFLLLAPTGVLVIDLRDVAGLIFGSEQMTEWTVMQKTRRFTFANPLGPLYDRIAVVRMIAGEGVPVEGRVVFTDRGTFPKGHPEHVTRLASLSTEFPPLDAAQVEPVVGRWRAGWDRLKQAASPSPLRRR